MFSIDSTARVNASRSHMGTLPSRRPEAVSVDPQLQLALDTAAEISQRYKISSLEPLLNSCHSALVAEEITVAILGRFKAGKSTFVNALVGRPLLPVGVVPVTTVVTEIRFGPLECAQVRFLDGHVEEVSPEEIAQ